MSSRGKRSRSRSHRESRQGVRGRIHLTEGVRRKQRRFNGSSEADVRGFSQKPGGIAVCSPIRQTTSVDTLHLANKIVFGGFRGQSFPRVKALTYFGRGALRLSGGLWLTTPHRDGVNVRLGGGTAFRREAAGMKRSSRKTVGLRTHGA